MSIDDIWAELRQTNTHSAFRRVDETHPLNFYLGIGTSGHAQLLLVSPQKLEKIVDYQALRLEVGMREDGLFAYTLSLQDRALEPLFSQLCLDIIDNGRNIAPRDGAKYLAKRLERWRRLLAGATSGLSEEETRGFVTELYLLHSKFIPKFGIEAAIRGWTGPHGQEQDFRIDDVAYEVKAIEVGKQTIQISSLGQLDSGGMPLRLIAVSLTTSDKPDAFCIAMLVEKITEQLAENAAVREVFEACLVAVGYALNDPAISRCYSFSGIKVYNVAEGFPLLTSRHVPVGIVEARYTVDLNHCTAFLRPEVLDGD